MIRVTVELWPHGFQKNKILLAGVQIANNMTGTLDRGNYDVKFLGKRGRWLKRTAQVVYFPRKRLTVLHLLARALKNAGYCNWYEQEELASIFGEFPVKDSESSPRVLEPPRGRVEERRLRVPTKPVLRG